MSLSFIKTISPMPDFNEDWTGIYSDPVDSLHRFVYDAANDRFVVGAVYNVSHGISVWPVNLYFDGETGAYLGGESAPWNLWQVMGYLPMVWSPGSFGKVYSTAIDYFLPTYMLCEIDISTRLPIIAMAVASNTWNPPSYFSICSYCMERQEAIIVESNPFGTNEIEIWDCSNPLIPVQKSKLIPPGIVANLCYENKELMWLITEDGIIAKFNYELANPRWEMLSSVQDPGGDTLGYQITYDTKRKRVVVFRIRADSGGKNQSSIEFYRPYYTPSQITDPVPVSKLVGGYDVDFIGHLLGSAGEGVAGQMVIPSLADGAKGTLLTNVAPTAMNGAFTVKYKVENSLYSDVLELECDVEDVFA